MRKGFGFLLLLLLVSLCAAALAEPAPLGTAVIDGRDSNRVHLREEPSSSAQSLGLLFSGTQVLYYTEPSDSWVEVSVYGKMGYVKSDYLHTGDPSQVAAQVRQAKIVHIAANSWVNLRKDIGQRADVLAQLKLGDQVTVLGELTADGGWSIVQAKSMSGFIATEYLAYMDVAYVEGQDTDRVHLRASASQTAASKGLYFTGTQVICLSALNETWVKVQIGSETGYIMAKYLSREAVAPKQPTAVVANIEHSDMLSIYAVPQARAELAGSAGYGEKLIVLGETQEGWCYVRHGNEMGYLMAEYLTIDE